MVLKKFYDTNALLTLGEEIFNEPFVISSVSLKELEHIKTSSNKDEEIKYKARCVVKLLDNYSNYEVVYYKFQNILEKFELEDDPDNRIIASAYYYHTNVSPIIFVTNDICCKMIAKNIVGLEVDSIGDSNDGFSGYKEVILNDDELADFYENSKINRYNLLINEYLIILDENNKVIEIKRWDGNSYTFVFNKIINSKSIAKIKPKDVYQIAALDSFSNNKITMIRGSAGTGKTYLALGYLFELLESKKIDKIIIFCNTVATHNSAKLGFLPGTKNDKLLDSSVGNMLISKLGSREIVEKLIEDNKLILLPMCDVRGYDTTKMKAGVYISEAQNLDVELMKLALQRIGNDCVCIVDGDFTTQVDSSEYSGRNNGMRRLSEVFRGQDFYGEVELKKIYRSKIAELAQLM